MGKELLNHWREANPNIEMHAELVITRYID